MSISKPKTIGVVLCAYNGARYLREQIDSILAQTRPPSLILILDDCSKDDTAAIAESYARKDPRIRLIRNESNLGYAKNFEKGISLCDTDFIALSDQDDIWLPEKLERLAAELESHPGSGMAYCNAEYMLADGTRSGHPVFAESDGFTADPVQSRRGLLEAKWNVHGNFILLESEMKTLIVPNPIIRSHGHDSWICLNAFFLRKPRYVSTPLSLYRLHPDMASGAISMALKGTPYDYKKKWTLRRLKRTVIRLFTAPLTRSKRHRERRERTCSYASDNLQVLELLLEKRRHLDLPPISAEESRFFDQMRSKWAVTLKDNQG